MPTASHTLESPVTTELSLRLNPGREAVPAARNALDALSDLLDRPVWEDLRLLITEVVTNGVRHGSVRGPVGVWVKVEDDSIRAEVTDGGRGFTPPEAPMPHHDGSGGWGLQLVDRVAASWGVDVADGTRVWFELAR